MSVELIILNFSYIAIFLLLIVNGIISFPSSQLIFIICGYFAFKGKLDFSLIILIGSIGMSIGNIVLYEISRKYGLKYVLKFNKFIGMEIFSPKVIKQVNAVMKRKGLWFLIVGKLVNPIKVIIPIPAGISKINRAAFISIVYITSFIWGFAFTYLGFLFGETFKFAIYYTIIVIILASLIMFIFYKYMNSEKILKAID